MSISVKLDKQRIIEMTTDIIVMNGNAIDVIGPLLGVAPFSSKDTRRPVAICGIHIGVSSKTNKLVVASTDLYDLSWVETDFEVPEGFPNDGLFLKSIDVKPVIDLASSISKRKALAYYAVSMTYDTDTEMVSFKVGSDSQPLQTLTMKASSGLYPEWQRLIPDVYVLEAGWWAWNTKRAAKLAKVVSPEAWLKGCDPIAKLVHSPSDPKKPRVVIIDDWLNVLTMPNKPKSVENWKT